MKSLNPLVSIITLNHNRQDDVLALIASVKKQRFGDFEMIVVDNASVDNSVELIRKKYPNVQVLARKEGRGYPSFNLGLMAARGKYLIVLDSDTEIDINLCERVIKKFEPDVLVIVDAAMMEEEPGRIRVFSEKDVDDAYMVTPHKVSMTMYMQYLRHYLKDLKGVFIGIQPLSLSYMEEMSPAVKESVELIAEYLTKLLQ